jgi:hypothetical protein
MSSLSSDYSVASTTDIDADILTLTNAYNTNSNTFTPVQRAAVVSMVDQLQARVNTNPATTLENTNDSILMIEEEIKKAKDDLNISQERVKMLRNPEASRSYYESWFPINRPLRNSTNIIALALGIFFFVFFFLMVVHSLGFIFNINISWTNPETYVKVATLFPWFGIAIIIVLVILVIVAYLRKT